jgi:hypothetical protein
MTTQTEAERLAEWLERRQMMMLQDRQAAAELRRLHEVNQELLDEVARLKALAEQPAQQEQPYGWHTEDHLTDRSATTYSKDVADRWQSKGWPVTPFYTTPPAPAQEPDPDELTIAYMSGLYEGKKRKPWVGLTEDEMRALKQKMVEDSMLGIVTDFEYIRSIEAKLKEKNTKGGAE